MCAGRQTHLIGKRDRVLALADVVILFMAMAIFAFCAGLFANHQTIWVDETTQLTGLSLTFSEQLAWLSGQSDKVLGVPPDRSPPLSYWIGSVWAAIFGLSETSLRWMGILAVCLAAPAVYLSGKSVGGRNGGILALGLVLLSGNVIVGSVEIRAYPLYFAASAWATYFFVRLVVLSDCKNSTHDLVLLCVFLLLSIYSHFFGVVAAACMLSALVVNEWLSERGISRILIAIASLVLLASAITPFVLAAVNVSSDGAAQAVAPSLFDSLRGLVRLTFRLAAHSSYLAAPSVLALFLAALAGLAAIAVIRVWSDPRNTPADGSMSLLTGRQVVVLTLPLVFAICGLTVVNQYVNSFDVLAPHYNLWLLPLPAILLAVAYSRLEHGPSWMRLAAHIAGVIAIACNIVAVFMLLRQPLLYSHGPGEWAVEAIRDPQATLVIHDGTGPWGFLYFPLHYLTGGEVTQWVSDPAGGFTHVTPNGSSPIASPKAQAKKFTTIIQVKSRSLDSFEIGSIARGSVECEFDSFPTVDIGKEKANLAEYRHFCAFVSASLAIWQK